MGENNPEWLPPVEQLLHEASDTDVEWVIKDCRDVMRYKVENGPFDTETMNYIKELGTVLMSAIKERDQRKITGPIYGFESD